MDEINEMFEHLLSYWNLIPKGLKTKFYMFKYKHVKGIQPCGLSKKIEMLEAAGWRIRVERDEPVKPLLTTPEDVFKHICLNWDDYPKEFEAEDRPFMKAYIKDSESSAITTFRKNKMIERAGFKQVYIK